MGTCQPSRPGSYARGTAISVRSQAFSRRRCADAWLEHQLGDLVEGGQRTREVRRLSSAVVAAVTVP